VITWAIHSHVLKVPASVWAPTLEMDGEVRDGAWVAELSGDVLGGWPKGMGLIVRRQPPHSGAQSSITDADGVRITRLSPRTPPIGRSPNSSSATGCGSVRRTASGPRRSTGLRKP
jgi:hypothetical protein